MADNENKLYEQLSQQLGLSPRQIQASAQRGDMDSLTQKLDKDKAAQLNQILSDPAKAKAVLESPQAQALMKLLNQQ